jgi:hypothetical protein
MLSIRNGLSANTLAARQLHCFNDLCGNGPKKMN